MRHEPSVLLVDDDAIAIAVLGRTLAGFGRLRFATNGIDALRLAQEDPPTLVLLDIEMPGLSGFEVCAAMKEDPLLRDVPVIFITGHSDTEQEVAGLRLGAVDFISKPLTPLLVQARVRTQLNVKRMADDMRQAAVIDGVTGIANRRRFDEAMPRELLRAARSHVPIAVLMIDVDHFKAYNDHYGHTAGDAALRGVAEALSRATRRPGDLVARFGGEEFVLIAPDTDASGVMQVANRMLECIDALALPHAASAVAGHVTVSIGACAFDAACHQWHATAREGRGVVSAFNVQHDLLAAADVALYAAKHRGRHAASFFSLDEWRALPAATPVGNAVIAHVEAA